MKRATIRELRSNVSEIVGGDDAVLVTRNGKPAALLYPLGNPRTLPLEIRRKLYLELSAEIARDLDAKGITEAEIQRDFKAHQKRRGGQ
jgi:antitoxin (DNA-binding transcriptional repressor) of toxin-antitoxin stability system